MVDSADLNTLYSAILIILPFILKMAKRCECSENKIYYFEFISTPPPENSNASGL